MDSNPNPEPMGNHVQRDTLSPDWAHAKQRASVIVTRNGRTSLGQLVFWPGDRPKRNGAKVRVLLASGAYISVNPEEVTLTPTITS